MDNQETNFINNSGQGKNIEVDSIIAKRFNWGAFLLGFIWGLFNKTYITLIVFIFCFLPKSLEYILILMCSIWFGIKGNTWAWQNKHWESIEHFHSVQKKWAIVGIIPFIIFTTSLFVIDIYVRMPHLFVINKLPIIYEQINQCKSFAKNAMEAINNTNKACDLTSENLTKCFSKHLDIISNEKNVLVLKNSSIWKFVGTENSEFDYSYIRIDANGKKSPNRYGVDIFSIPLYIDKNGKFMVEENIKQSTGLILLENKK